MAIPRDKRNIVRSGQVWVHKTHGTVIEIKKKDGGSGRWKANMLRGGRTHSMHTADLIKYWTLCE
jgi:hypothetical protein